MTAADDTIAAWSPATYRSRLLWRARREEAELRQLCKLLTEWRNGPETSWLADALTHPLQQTLKNLGRAYANFFAKRAGLQAVRDIAGKRP